MADMKRVTPDDIVEAYKKTGIRPVERDWVKLDPSDKPCGCAMTALYLSKVQSAVIHLLPATESKEAMTKEIRCLIMDEDDGEDMEILYSEELGLPVSYIQGFIQAFDGLPRKSYVDKLMYAGYEDGTAARERIFSYDEKNDVLTVLI